MFRKPSRPERSIAKKIYLAFEGTKTEPRYFNGIIQSKTSSDKIELIPLYRGVGKKGNSNPGKIIDDMIDYIEYLQEKRYSTNLFVEQVLTSLVDQKLLYLTDESDAVKKFNDIKRELMSKKASNEKDILNREAAFEVLGDYLYRTYKRRVPVNITDLPDRFHVPNDSDMYCLIVDRDSASFKQDQVTEVRSKCEKHGFNLYITNPYFELWLLLHFDVSKECLIEASKCKQGLKKELTKYSDINSSLNFNFNEYLYNISVARMKLMNYCQNIDILEQPFDSNKDAIGSNIGELMDVIFENGYPSK